MILNLPIKVALLCEVMSWDKKWCRGYDAPGQRSEDECDSVDNGSECLEAACRYQKLRGAISVWVA